MSLHVAANICINCSFVHLYLLFYNSLHHFRYFGPYYFSCFQAVFIGFIIWFIFDNLCYMSISTMFVPFQLFHTIRPICRSRIF